MQVIHGSRYSFTKAFCIAFVMTFFSAFDVPVFWPILLCYWIVLFVLTMRRQIAHMIKYKYVPFNIGKQVSLNYFSLFLRISPLSLLEAPSVHSMDYNCTGISIWLVMYWDFRKITIWFPCFLQRYGGKKPSASSSGRKDWSPQLSHN